MKKTINTDIVIIGAGASGLMCAAEAGKRGKNVIILDHNKKPGKKILMSGGGKCNFTNYFLGPENFVSKNPHFCKSAIKRFTNWDFIAMVEENKLRFEEREHGQLFLKDSSAQILEMLLNQCRKSNIKFFDSFKINDISKKGSSFTILSDSGNITCKSLVIATGGPSIPASGASSFGYETAVKFGINVIKPEPALVPFTLSKEHKEIFSMLSGIAIDAVIKTSAISFKDKLLFTHRGLSGPVVLKASLYWNPGENIFIDLLPGMDISEILNAEKKIGNKKKVKNFISDYFPKRLIESVFKESFFDKAIKNLNLKEIEAMKETIHNYKIKPQGTEGNRTAEATRGGVDCNEISSKTMESKNVPGLYFIGEVLDVTGWLGGYNLQWAWSSGWCAGQFV